MRTTLIFLLLALLAGCEGFEGADNNQGFLIVEAYTEPLNGEMTRYELEPIQDSFEANELNVPGWSNLTFSSENGSFNIGDTVWFTKKSSVELDTLKPDTLK